MSWMIDPECVLTPNRWHLSQQHSVFHFHVNDLRSSIDKPPSPSSRARIISPANLDAASRWLNTKPSQQARTLSIQPHTPHQHTRHPTHNLPPNNILPHNQTSGGIHITSPSCRSVWFTGRRYVCACCWCWCWQNTCCITILLFLFLLLLLLLLLFVCVIIMFISVIIGIIVDNNFSTFKQDHTVLDCGSHTADLAWHWDHASERLTMWMAAV